MARRVIFSVEARADIRAIDREIAIRLLHSLARYLQTGIGTVKQLEGYDPPRFRLRVGDWGFIFHKRDDSIEVLRVRNRREAYR